MIEDKAYNVAQGITFRLTKWDFFLIHNYPLAYSIGTQTMTSRKPKCTKDVQTHKMNS